MPPRFVYWTILIDNQPTAFRAARREDLLPTLNQLQRKSTNVVMKWFARGKVWDSPEAERAAQAVARPQEKRGRDWRPGGAHKDPRDRFKKKNRPERAWSDKPDLRGDREKLGPPREMRRWTPKPQGAPRSDRPWPDKQSKPFKGAHDRPRDARTDGKPRQTKPLSSGGQRKPFGRPAVGAHGKPWTGKPGGPPRGDRPWQGKSNSGGRTSFRPRTGPGQSWPRKKRDDEPPDRG